MNAWQKANPVSRIKELQEEREYHLKALENIEAQIQRFKERLVA
jgi:hypothetical protein